MISSPKIPVENIIGAEGKGLRIALTTLNTGRLTLPVSAAAGGLRAVELIRAWINERVQWGQPVGKHDAVAQMVANITATSFAMDAIAGLCDPSGRLFGLMPHPEAYVDRTQHPRWTRGEGGEVGDGMRIFRNAVDFFA